MTHLTMRISEITIEDRHRKELGDLDTLARSIEAIGLLHAVVVTPAGRLIDGERRIRACQQLGWTEIAVNVVDLEDLLRGEFDANTARKDFTPSEMANIARAMRPIEEAKAKERQGTRTDLTQTLREVDSGESRDKIASRLGTSRETLRKIETVVEAAEAEPETFAPLVEEMDRTGKVDAAYREMRRVVAEREQAESDAAVETLVAANPELGEEFRRSNLRSKWREWRIHIRRAPLAPDELQGIFDSPIDLQSELSELRMLRASLDEFIAALSRTELRVVGE